MYACVCVHISMFIVWLLGCVLMQVHVGVDIEHFLNLSSYILRQGLIEHST